MPSQRPHILAICSWFPNRVQPTNGNFVERHLRLLEEDITLGILQVEYDPALPNGESLTTQSADASFDVTTIYFGSTASRSGRLWQRLRWFQSGIKDYIQQNGTPDLIHVHVAMPAVLVAYWIQLRLGIPYVLSCHSSGFLPISSRQYPWWQRWLLTRAANSAKMVCPVSQALAKAWQQNGLRASIQVIPNVVDTEVFYPANDPIPTPPLRLLHISNFAPEAKNVYGILRVAARLKQTGFPFTLTIAGDGDLRTVEDYAQQLGLDDRHLQLQGVLSGEQVATYMRSHHCFILFSNYETQGITAMEAVCCGLSVIATRVGGLPEIIDQAEKGTLIEAGDEDALFTAIQNFDSTRKGDIIRGLLPYSTEQVRQKLLGVYQRVLSAAE
ncbi:MAG: glycosyltransferase [Bacteroidota bacterium]